MDKKIYFTPGPSKLYDNVSDYVREALDLGICSLSHRSSVFQDIYKKAQMGVRGILDVPDDYNVFFVSSATEAMERFVQNCVKRKSFHIVGGAFGKRFYQTAEEYGKEVSSYDLKEDHKPDISAEDVPEDAEMLCVTQSETSTGAVVSMEKIREIHNMRPNSLLVLDVVSAMPAVKIDWDVVDGVFFSVQKGMGLPAGLGIMVVGPRAMKKSKDIFEEGGSIGSYHNFSSLFKNAEKSYTVETPNVLDIYLLGRVCDDMMSKGILKIRKEIKEKAEFLYSFIEENSSLDPYVKDPDLRSKMIVVADVVGGSKFVLDELSKKGLIVGAGYGEMKERQIRIANFPAHSMDDMVLLVNELKNIL